MDLRKLLHYMLCGICIGVVLGLFRLLIFGPLTLFTIKSLPLFFAVALSSLLISRWLIERHSILRGSGVPHVKSFLTGKRKIHPLKEGGLKFIMIIILNNLGFSIGSAGPSVFIGASAGAMASRNKMADQPLLGVFASAGLAAFFSAPFAGLALALEEFQLKRDPRTLLRALLIISVAWGTSFILFGHRIGLIDGSMPNAIELNTTVALLLIAFVATGAGLLFKTLLLKSPPLGGGRFKIIFIYLLPLLFLLLARRIPEVAGGGIILLNALSHSISYAVPTLALFLFFKFAFTLSCVITNIPAGLFMPSLSIGGALGTLMLALLLPSELAHPSLYIACGAAFFFYALMRRPLLSVFISTELFADYRFLIFLIPLMVIVHAFMRKTDDQPLNEILHALIDDTSVIPHEMPHEIHAVNMETLQSDTSINS